MRTIRVETSAATILLTEAPEPKVRDRQTGEIAKDATSGETLMKVGVVYIDEGESLLIHVTVPESGVSEGLASVLPSHCPASSPGHGSPCSTGSSATGSSTAQPPSPWASYRPERRPDVRPVDAGGGGRPDSRARWRGRLPPGPAPGGLLVHGRDAAVIRAAAGFVQLGHGVVRPDHRAVPLPRSGCTGRLRSAKCPRTGPAPGCFGQPRPGCASVSGSPRGRNPPTRPCPSNAAGTPGAFRALRMRHAQQTGDRKAAGELWQDSRGLIFTTRYGTPIEPGNLTRMFALPARRAGLRVIPLRNTRHTCSSLLVALKVHPKVAQRILRHSQIAMTMEVYAEASDEAVRAAIGQLSDAMGGTG